MIGMVADGRKPGRLEVGEWVRKGKEDWRVMVRLAAAVRVEERGDMEKVKGAVKGLEDIVVKGERDEDHGGGEHRPGLQLFTKLTSPSIHPSFPHPPTTTEYGFGEVWKMKGMLNGGEVSTILKHHRKTQNTMN